MIQQYGALHQILSTEISFIYSETDFRFVHKIKTSLVTPSSVFATGKLNTYILAISKLVVRAPDS